MIPRTLAFLSLAVCTAVTFASRVAPTTLESLAKSSDGIVLGKVNRTTTPKRCANGEGFLIQVDLQVTATIHGKAPAKSVDVWAASEADAHARAKVGGTYLAFLTPGFVGAANACRFDLPLQNLLEITTQRIATTRTVQGEPAEQDLDKLLARIKAIVGKR